MPIAWPGWACRHDGRRVLVYLPVDRHSKENLECPTETHPHGHLLPPGVGDRRPRPARGSRRSPWPAGDSPAADSRWCRIDPGRGGPHRPSEPAGTVHHRQHRQVPPDSLGMLAIRQRPHCPRSTHAFRGPVFPGGTACSGTSPATSRVLRMIEDTVAAQKPVAMVCHAPGIPRTPVASPVRPWSRAAMSPASSTPKTTNSISTVVCCSLWRTS